MYTLHYPLGKKLQLEYCMEPPDTNLAPWPVTQWPVALQTVITTLKGASHKGSPALGWQASSIATAGASRRPLAWTEHGSPYKASQSRSFPLILAQPYWSASWECMVKPSSPIKNTVTCIILMAVIHFSIFLLKYTIMRAYTILSCWFVYKMIRFYRVHI